MKPQERMQRFGPNALTETELVSLILRSGTKAHTIDQIVPKLLPLLDSYPTIHTLTQIQGIGIAKASQLLAVIELMKRKQFFKKEKHIISSPKEVAKLCAPLFNSQETLIACYLDTKLELICAKTIFIGSLNSITLHTREIFHHAMKHLAHSIIISHNHPSGDPKPSEEDIIFTRNLSLTAAVVGIPLLDHVIVSPSSFWAASQQKPDILHEHIQQDFSTSVKDHQILHQQYRHTSEKN